MPSAEEQDFTTNFRNTEKLHMNLVRVTNIANTIQWKRAFKSLIEQQEWQFGPLVRVDFVHEAKVKRPREDTTIAFVQFKLTIMHYHLARQFQNHMLHGQRLYFQMAGETNDLIVSKQPSMVSRSTQVTVAADKCEQGTMTTRTIEHGRSIANKCTNTSNERVLVFRCTKGTEVTR